MILLSRPPRAPRAHEWTKGKTVNCAVEELARDHFFARLADRPGRPASAA